MAFKGNRKAQSGIELITYFGFLFMLFLVLSLEAASRMGSIQRSRDSFDAQKVGEIAATNINIAYSVGEGYSASFFLPFGLVNSNYSLNISTEEQRLDITYGENFTKSFPLLTSNVTGIPRQGANSINNTRGEIIIA